MNCNVCYFNVTSSLVVLEAPLWFPVAGQKWTRYLKYCYKGFCWGSKEECLDRNKSYILPVLQEDLGMTAYFILAFIPGLKSSETAGDLWFVTGCARMAVNIPYTGTHSPQQSPYTMERKVKLNTGFVLFNVIWCPFPNCKTGCCFIHVCCSLATVEKLAIIASLYLGK